MYVSYPIMIVIIGKIYSEGINTYDPCFSRVFTQP